MNLFIKGITIIILFLLCIPFGYMYVYFLNNIEWVFILPIIVSCVLILTTNWD